MTDTIREPARDLLVMDEADVLVVGGGPAGVGAALAAARLGRDVLVVEQFNCLGGIATAGGHGHICLFTSWASYERVVGGVGWEIAKRVAAEGFGKLSRGNVDFEIEGMKRVLEQMAAEAGVRLLYYTQFAEALIEGGRVAGAVVQSKSGRAAVRARQVVDCTGDADVAASAGAPFEKGRPEDGRMQPMTLMFQIGGVDYDRVAAFRQGDWKLQHVWKEAQDAGDMEPFQSQIMGWWWTPTRPDQVGINFTHITGMDATDVRDLTAATIEGRRQAFHTVEVCRKYVPGMENAYLLSTPAVVGTRESRRIVGEVVLTREDLLEERQWPDSVGYGSFFIDIHNPDGPGMSDKTYRPHRGFKYQIPYRILVPRDVENLLVAGRCVSVTHEALGSIRVMPQCTVTGEAAGTAAHLALDAGCPVRQVDVAALQAQLRAQGDIVDAEDIARVNAGVDPESGERLRPDFQRTDVAGE